MNRELRLEKLTQIAKERVLILDGAMGTELQTFKLTEEDFRGEQFKDVNSFLKGNNDLLNLTKPEVVKEVIAGILKQVQISLKRILFLQQQLHRQIMRWSL